MSFSARINRVLISRPCLVSWSIALMCLCDLGGGSTAAGMISCVETGPAFRASDLIDAGGLLTDSCSCGAATQWETPLSQTTDDSPGDPSPTREPLSEVGVLGLLMEAESAKGSSNSGRRRSVSPGVVVSGFFQLPPPIVMARLGAIDLASLPPPPPGELLEPP